MPEDSETLQKVYCLTLLSLSRDSLAVFLALI